jgi:hypothetical protein
MFPIPVRRTLARLFLVLAALVCWSDAALAQVNVEFHSFNGSFFGSRFPHTFVVFDGTLDSTGETIHSNYGFSAKTVSPAVLAGPVKHVVYSEKEKYVKSTNVHFTIAVSDETYHRMMREVIAWRDAPGKYYDLDTRNCIHFVGRLAELAGLKVDYPHDLLRKPKAWLNHIGDLNPQLGARPIP